MKGINVSGSHSFNCLESVVRTAASLPSAAFTGLVPTLTLSEYCSGSDRGSYNSVVQMLTSLPLSYLCMKCSWQEMESRTFTVSVHGADSSIASQTAALHQHPGHYLW
jgi:hypothetical protein